MQKIKIMLLILATASLFGCATAEIPDFKAYITLPASGDGYWVQTVSANEGRVPQVQWAQMQKHGIVLLSDDWKILRAGLLKNCLSMDCKTAVGTFDNLFNSLDSALGSIPIHP